MLPDSRAPASQRPCRSGAPSLVLSLAVAMIAATAPLAHDDNHPRLGVDGAPAPIDLALCLDTSGSMSGLIDAAKQKLWAIVNDLGNARPAPRLRVALLTYGNDGHSPEDGWVRLDVPFTEDLDRISEQLFALTTNGGTELVARVVSVARGQLDWSPAILGGLHMVMVAGNEGADQDTVLDSLVVASAALDNDIVVNTIYCGGAEDPVAKGWRLVAQSGGGHFASIDRDNGTLAIATPFDAKMALLSSALNETYVPFGSAGIRGCENQRAQDANISSVNAPAAADRAMTKAQTFYNCESWDLVDAVANGKVVLVEVPIADLPEVLQALDAAERAAHLTTLGAKRKALAKKIKDMDKLRKAWAMNERERLGLDDELAFDRAVRTALRSLAESRGFQFEPDATPRVETAPVPVPVPVQAVVLPPLMKADDC
jgi:hypothetical protein